MRRALAVLWLLSACHDDGFPDRPDAAVGTTVLATAVDVWHTPNGTMERSDPFDFTVLVETANGDYYSVYGIVAPNNGKGALNIPEGEAIASSRDPFYGETFYLYTAARQIDFGRDYLGTIRQKGIDQVLSLAVDGLAAWDPSDSLRVASASANMEMWAEYEAIAPPADGATSATVDLPLTDVSIPDPAAGDDVVVFQIRTSFAADVVSRVVNVGSVASIDGTGNDLSASVTLTDAAAATFDHELSWTAFDALRADAFAGALPADVYVTVAAQPFEEGRGPYSEDYDYRVWDPFTNPELVFVSLDHSDGPRSVSYVDGFPADWTRYVHVEAWFELPVPLLPDTQTAYAWARYMAWLPLADVDDAALLPLIGPPRDVTIDGAPWAAGATVGERPVIAWSPPALGTPSYYVVSLRRLEKYGTYTFAREFAHFQTTNTSMKLLPRTLLKAGEQYIFTVAAVWDPNSDPATNVRRLSFPRAFAEAASGPISR